MVLCWAKKCLRTYMTITITRSHCEAVKGVKRGNQIKLGKRREDGECERVSPDNKRPVTGTTEEEKEEYPACSKLETQRPSLASNTGIIEVWTYIFLFCTHWSRSNLLALAACVKEGAPFDTSISMRAWRLTLETQSKETIISASQSVGNQSATSKEPFSYRSRWWDLSRKRGSLTNKTHAEYRLSHTNTKNGQKRHFFLLSFLDKEPFFSRVEKQGWTLIACRHFLVILLLGFGLEKWFCGVTTRDEDWLWSPSPSHYTPTKHQRGALSFIQ